MTENKTYTEKAINRIGDEYSFISLLFGFVVLIGLIIGFFNYWFGEPIPKKPPLKISIPKAEAVGENVADKATRFVKGAGKGVWKNINPFPKKE